MKRWSFCAVLLALLGGMIAPGSTALAAGPTLSAKRAEATMLVTGSITLAPDGTVRSYSIYRREALPEPVAELIDNNASAWRFEPVVVQGQPVAAIADMSLRVLAGQLQTTNTRCAFAARTSAIRMRQRASVG